MALLRSWPLVAVPLFVLCAPVLAYQARELPTAIHGAELSTALPGFPDTIDEGDLLGAAVAPLGDFDGDGVVDLAVGSPGDDDGEQGSSTSGGLRLVFLNADGTAKAWRTINATGGGLGELDVLPLPPGVRDLGSSLACVGDADGDGVVDLAAGFQTSSVQLAWLLLLEADGTVKDVTPIAEGQGGFAGDLTSGDEFGSSFAALGDVDGDGITDLAVGAQGTDGGGLVDSGAVWILLMNADATVKDEVEISLDTTALPGLALLDHFGASVAPMGDVDGDGVVDLAVGSPRNDVGGSVYLLFLNADGTVKATTRVLGTSVGTTFGFGAAVTAIGDVDGDGVTDLAVGAEHNSINPGAVWIVFLNAGGSVKTATRLGAGSGGFTGTLDDDDAFGAALAFVGDVDASGTPDLFVGARGDDDGRHLTTGQPEDADSGALWRLSLNTDGTVAAHQKISPQAGNPLDTLDKFDELGGSVVHLGDLDGDGHPEVAAGAGRDDEAGLDAGCVWILFTDGSGGVKDYQRITEGSAGFTGDLDPSDDFGVALACLGDLDGDGVVDLAVGAHDDSDGGLKRGAVWVLFLNADGTVKGHRKISSTAGNFLGALDDLDFFGSALANLGDLDGDGVVDLAVGAREDDDGGINQGAVWILFLNADGTVAAETKISETSGSFLGDLGPLGLFGGSLATLGDLDGDGVVELAAGAPQASGGGLNRGEVWILFLDTDGTVKDEARIGNATTILAGRLDDRDFFGQSAAPAGDWNGDGTIDLAVGAPFDDDGEANAGAVWILLLASDGTVLGARKLGAFVGREGRPRAPGDWFGSALAAFDDPRAPGGKSLLVGIPGEDDGGRDHGGVEVLRLVAGERVRQAGPFQSR